MLKDKNRSQPPKTSNFIKNEGLITTLVTGIIILSLLGVIIIGIKFITILNSMF